MSTKSLAKTGTEYWISVLRQYQKEHPGAFSDDRLLDWALENGYADLPKPNPRAILKRKLKQTLRAARIHDLQGRKVRQLLPAKVEAVDANGNRVFEVMWDHIHEMSLKHALESFDQRDANINKQEHAASRDLRSCLENNPNVAGHEPQFLFDFMSEESEAQVVEEIQESGRPANPR